MSFPSPVGGAALPADFAPSIVFIVMYGCLVPLMLYRLLHRRSWNLLLIGSIAFSIERVVVFSLRAVQSRDEGKRMSKGFLTYMQLTVGMGFISIAQNLINFIRCLLVNATYGTYTIDQAPAVDGAKRATKSRSSFEAVISKHPIGEVVLASGFIPDSPRQRFLARRFTDFANIAFVAAIVPGILANSRFGDLLEHPEKSSYVMTLRYTSTAVALFLTLSLALAAVWARLKVPRINRHAIRVLLVVASLISVTAIYRLSVMYHTTTSLTSEAPGALNSSGAKAAFYIFHMLSEWLSIATLLGCNVREIFGTGPFGDWRSKDETEKERAKREAKQARKADKERQISQTADANIPEIP